MTNQEKPNRLRLVRDTKVVPLTLVGVPEQTLEKVLEHLQENDELFDYNVPDEWRDPAREGLQEYLVRTYLQENFEITGKDAVKKYIRLYDHVEFDSDYPVFEYGFYLKPGMKGIIKKVDLDKKHPITILWEPCDEFPKEKKLCHHGTKLSLLPNGFFRRQKISSRIELLAAAAPGRLVEPTEVYFEYSHYLPVGIRGIVTKIDKSAKLPVIVVFGNTEGYIPPKKGIMNCPYACLKLSRENRIDIRKLIGEFS